MNSTQVSNRAERVERRAVAALEAASRGWYEDDAAFSLAGEPADVAGEPALLPSALEPTVVVVVLVVVIQVIVEEMVVLE